MPKMAAKDLINVIAVVGFIALFGSGVVLGLESMADAVDYDVNSVTNETHNSSGSVPEAIQVDKVGEGLEQDQGVYLYDSFDGSTYKLDSSEYSVTLSNGTYNFDTADLDGDGNDEINATSDEYRISYDWKEKTQAEGFINKSIGAFDVVPGLLEVIVVFGFVAVLIGLLWYAVGRLGLGKMGRSGL
ncbi:MAG: hypothetical protein BRC29_03430 [Nanohaloarchaea archaeon SW_7_43_1]|nr:MAG: hypothetical protein BRC29_03430 [Nanohaloarchaea archaeon SW_7_43_1]